MKITGAQVFDLNEGFVNRDLYIDGQLLADASGDDQILDATGLIAIPGLTDLHFHGAMGADVSDGDAKGLQDMADYELSRGVTQICPAGMTLLPEDLIHMCEVAANHRDHATTGADLVGIHLEGPFLSTAKKGAQNGDWIQDPNLALFRKLEETAKGLIKVISLAPEQPGAMDFIRDIKDCTVVSLAHTTADYDTAMAAYAAGATHTTHLYNAMPPFTHRSPGVVGAAFDSGVNVELICDDVHIHPSVVRATFSMFGAERMVLISDTMRAAGMPDGDYTLGGQAVTVKGRYATLADGTLAGSVTDLMSCMTTAVSMGIPLHHAVQAAAVNPAKILGIDGEVGTLDTGKRANVVLLNPDLTVNTVVFRGEIVRG